MSLFSHKSNSVQPTVYYGYPAQTSIYGVPIKLVYGQARVAGDVIWTGDWQANQVNQGGKSGGGKGASGKGGSGSAQYDYKTAIMIALCQGPILGIANIFVDKSKLAVASIQETATVPVSGGTYRTVTPSQASTFVGDYGTAYGSSYSVVANDYGYPAPETLAGIQYVPFVQVGSNPGPGQYSVDPVTGIYTFNSADAGKTVVIGYTFHQVTSSDTGQPIADLNLSLFNGATAQAPWSYLTTNHPAQALGYTGLAYVADSLMDLGGSGLVSNFSFELQGLLPFGGGITDAEPSAILTDFLTNTTYGVGFLPSEIGDLTQISTYCISNGLFISPVVDSQRAGRDWIQEWLQVANCEAFWSDGTLKIGCYGDKTTIGNGATYTPATQPIYDLGDDDFICNPGEEPIKVSRPSVREADNSISVEWCNRGNSYNYEPLNEKDDWSIAQYGLRPASPLSLHCITQQTVAQAVGITQLRRSVYIRNQFTFRLPATYALLEPMDLVTITDPYLGYYTFPVRILTIEEGDDASLTITAEEFPWSAATPSLYPKQVTSQFGPGYFAPPGSVNPPQFFYLPPDIEDGSLYTLGIALSGGQNWGGCLVYVSTDGGSSYTQVGRQTGIATMGVLTAQLPVGPDPDDTDTLAVDLTESFGALQSYTQAQENALVSLCAIENELISYRTATLTSQFAYNVTHLRRGAYGTAIAQHASGVKFCTVDDQIFRWTYDATVIDQTVYFKFCSFNHSGQRPEDLANVTAYPYFVANPRTALTWAPGYTVPVTNDPIWTADKFGIVPTTASDGFGNPIVAYQIWGNPPCNVFSDTATVPILNSVTAVAAGGSIPAGTYLVAVSAFDGASNSDQTDLSNIVVVTVPSSGYKITLNVTWGTGNYGGAVYVAAIDGTHPFYYQAGIATGSPSSGTHNYDVTSVAQVFLGAPDDKFDHLAFRIRRVIHGGIWAQQATAVGTNTLTFAGVTFTTNQWAGRRISLLAFVNPAATPIIWDATVNSNTATVLTLDRDPTGIINVGDLIEMRIIPSSISSTQFSDSGFSNAFYPSGLAANAEVGNVAWIVAGTGAGQWRQIASNGSGAGPITLAAPWTTLPDATSIIIIVEPNWAPAIPQSSLQIRSLLNSSPFVIPPQLCGTVSVANYMNQTFIIQALTVAADGGFDEVNAPVWEIFQFGTTPGLRTITSSSTMLLTDVTVLIDTTSGNVDYTLLPTASYRGRRVSVVWKAGSNTARILPAAGETINGASSFTFSTVGDVKELVANG